MALMLCACASAPGAAPVAADPVIAAERAFAARAGEIGWIPAFREFVAPDGQLIGQAGLVAAPARLAALEDDGNRTLYWAPTYAGAARSGDLGFTTGPASFDAARTPAIQYFTVWRRQPDGAWRWIFDGGPGAVADPGPFLAEGAAVPTLPVAASGDGSAARAVAAVTALERGAANAAALSAHLAPDAHVYRAGAPRAFDGAEAVARMRAPSAEITYRGARAEGSAAGDLVFTLGHASWLADGAAREGVYARIWQHRPGGWAIVYDQLVVRPAPAN